MKRLPLENLLPGMITAEDVYDYSSQLILHKGQILTQKSISKLQFYAIAFIRVEDEMAEVPAPAAPVEEEPSDIVDVINTDIPAEEAEIPADTAEIPVMGTDIPATKAETPAIKADSPADKSDYTNIFGFNVFDPNLDLNKIDLSSLISEFETGKKKKTSSGEGRSFSFNFSAPEYTGSDSRASLEEDMKRDYRLPIPDEMPAEILAEIAALSPRETSFSEPVAEEPKLSHSKKVKSSKEFRAFKAAFNNEVQDFKNKLNEVIRKNAPLNVDKLLDDALSLISSSSGTYSVFDMLQYMRESDDVTYAHSLNVGLFCNVFSGWIRLSEEETRIATLAGLLCDIGKIQIPDHIIKKKDSLTREEYSIIKTHSLQGYMLLKDLDINPHVKYAALMHHERCDGSGYPFGLTGDKIDPYAKMVAIADVYDAMTSPRSFRGAISPFHAIEIIQEEGLQKYDARFIMTFLENVTNSFIGNTVHLSNGKQGEIVFIHKDDLTRPTVKCGSEFIDLHERKNIQVLEII